MTRNKISEDPSGRIILSFPHPLVLVSEVKTIEGRRWHPAEKYWSFPHTLSLAPRGLRRARPRRRVPEFATYSIQYEKKMRAQRTKIFISCGQKKDSVERNIAK